MSNSDREDNGGLTKEEEEALVKEIQKDAGYTDEELVGVKRVSPVKFSVFLDREDKSGCLELAGRVSESVKKILGRRKMVVPGFIRDYFLESGREGITEEKLRHILMVVENVSKDSLPTLYFFPEMPNYKKLYNFYRKMIDFYQSLNLFRNPARFPESRRPLEKEIDSALKILQSATGKGMGKLLGLIMEVYNKGFRFDDRKVSEWEADQIIRGFGSRVSEKEVEDKYEEAAKILEEALDYETSSGKIKRDTYRVIKKFRTAAEKNIINFRLGANMVLGSLADLPEDRRISQCYIRKVNQAIFFAFVFYYKALELRLNTIK